MPRSIILIVLCVASLLVGGSAEAARSAAVQEASADRGSPIDLNTATAADLERLPGVGERTAQLIIDYRTERGRFEKVEELMNIRGIGERTFLRIRPLVRVGTTGESSR